LEALPDAIKKEHKHPKVGLQGVLTLSASDSRTCVKKFGIRCLIFFMDVAAVNLASMSSWMSNSKTGPILLVHVQ